MRILSDHSGGNVNGQNQEMDISIIRLQVTEHLPYLRGCRYHSRKEAAGGGGARCMWWRRDRGAVFTALP